MVLYHSPNCRFFISICISDIFITYINADLYSFNYYGLKVSKKLDRGYDYVRKLCKKVNQIVWIGYAGIGLVVLNWILIYTNTLMNGI